MASEPALAREKTSAVDLGPVLYVAGALVLLGGASGQLSGNRHIVAPPQTPMSNLLLGMLDKLGVRQDSFGDSTGRLEL